jgi:hypothetical protein
MSHPHEPHGKASSGRNSRSSQLPRELWPNRRLNVQGYCGSREEGCIGWLTLTPELQALPRDLVVATSLKLILWSVSALITVRTLDRTIENGVAVDTPPRFLFGDIVEDVNSRCFRQPNSTEP